MKNNWFMFLLLAVLGGVVSCEIKTPNAERIGAVNGKCDSTRLLSTFDRSDSEVGFYNPKDSLYYGQVTVGLFYRGGLTNPCNTVERIQSFRNPISRKFRLVWQGPKGVTADQNIVRALILFTDKAYRDDVDRTLPKPDSLMPYPHAIKATESLPSLVVGTGREYKVSLRKGYSLLNDQVKCAEVSLSTTPAFDDRNIVLENAASASWSDRWFVKIDEIPANRQFVVVREKTCATCPEAIPTLTAAQTTITKGESVLLSFKGCATSTSNGQGPLEWSEQPVGGEKKLVQRFSYSSRNERFFSPEVTTTYFLRCQGDWYCKPQTEASVTIQVR